MPDCLNTFVILFDIGYIDKGLAVYHSLQKNAEHFRLYIVTMDDRTEEILNTLSLCNTVVIPESRILNDTLAGLKKERPRSSYSWTFKSYALEYIFRTYHEQICTYMDSDMYFFSDPAAFLSELTKGGFSVGLLPHNFDLRYELYQNTIRRSGEFCAGLITFINDPRGNAALQWWKEKVTERCPAVFDGELFADQKYLEEMAGFPGVHVYNHPGASLGPWNMAQFRIEQSENGFQCIARSDHTACPLILFHFQGIEYLENGHVNLHVMSRPEKISGKEAWRIYIPYLKKIVQIRDFLKDRFGIGFQTKSKEKQIADAKNYRRSVPLSISEIKRLIRRVLTCRYDFPDLKRLSATPHPNDRSECLK